MKNATLVMGIRRVPCAVTFHLGAGLKPDGHFLLESETGSRMALQLEPEAIVRMAAAIIVDPRFKVGGRNPKPDPDLQRATDDLFNRIMGA